DTSSNMDVDPLFANVANGDFSLTAYSPAIDAGNQYLAPLLGPTDLAGNTRLANQSLDLGALEFQGTPIKVSFNISVALNCGVSGPTYSLQLLTLSGTNVPLTGFQWMVNKNDGHGFTNISDGGVYTGTSTPNLTIANPPPSMNDYRYI